MESVEKILTTTETMSAATGVGTSLIARSPTATCTMPLATSPHTPPPPLSAHMPTHSPLTPATPLQPLVQTFTTPLHRKKGRLQRSERLQTMDNSSTNSSSASASNATTTPTSYSAWESLVKESFGQIAWPIKITSWELVDDRVKIVPSRSPNTNSIALVCALLAARRGKIMSKWSLMRSEIFSTKNSSKQFRNTVASRDAGITSAAAATSAAATLGGGMDKMKRGSHSLPSSPLATQLQPKPSARSSASPKANKKANNNTAKSVDKSKCNHVRSIGAKTNTDTSNHVVLQVTGVEVAAAAVNVTVTQASQVTAVMAVVSTENDIVFVAGRKYLSNLHDQISHTSGGASRTRLYSSTRSNVSQKIDEEEEEPRSEMPTTAKVHSTAADNGLLHRRRRFSSQPKVFQHCAYPVHYSQERSSSATELISRRGVFSRHHYGSVDQLPQSDLDGLDPNFKRFRVENGDSLAEKDEVFGSPSTPILENPEHQTRWYFKYFLGKLHQNYVGVDAEKNPYFLSVVSQESGHQGAPMYRAILFRKQGTQKIALPYQANQKLTVKQILTHFTGMDASAKNPKEIFTADIQKDLLLLEEQEGSVNFKFGVVYMKPGQDCDDEMLSNEDASQDFEDFLHILGERIRLKGWDRFRGGLDVKGDMTGKYSVYTLYEGHEIMFHVSTLLPYSRDNRQQVERKRHIGNDIVNIIFIDQPTANKDNLFSAQMDALAGQAPDGSGFIQPTAFDPTWIKSQFTHIFAVVTKIDDAYRLAVFCDENVPPFGPTLPNPPEFTDIPMLREFLLVKMINAEKATFQTPIFSQKRERTLDMLIKDLYEDYVSDSKLNMLNRRAFSEVLYDVPRTSKLKEDARQIEFVRIGQALKLEAIVRGDAPTSIASASPCTIFRKPPWEPHCFYPTFLHRGSLAGDSFGCNDDSLFIATDDGTFLMKEDQSHQLIFDKSFQVRQLNVLEDHGLVLIRGGSLANRDAHRMHVFRLREFQLRHAEDSLRCRSRAEVKERRIERTRGCHLYASSRISGGHLRLVVAVNRKLQLFQWKHTAAWASWCPESDTETVEGFIFQKEITLCESPSIITPLEGPTNTNAGGLICVGYKYHYEIVCDQTGTATRLYDLEPVKRNQAQLTAAIELCDGLETELLLCYNHTGHFQKLSERDGMKNDFDFHWNTSPTAVVCAFPYVLGFTSDSIEIRLLVNGNLVHTAMMPELQLITSKRDIFFVTTAPEFMSKDLHIKGLHINEFSPSERRLVTTPSEASSNEELSQGELLCLTPKDMPINPEHELTNLLEIPNASVQFPHIHRARSLQKTHNVYEEKPVIAKSNSCGDTDNRFNALRSSSIVAEHLQQCVPPNSPRNTNSSSNNQSSGSSNNHTSGSSNSNSSKSSQQSPMSPTRRTSKYRNLFNSVGGSGGGGGSNSPNFADGCSCSPDRMKPLRVYRIPLAKLTGAHSHFHMHAFNAMAAAGATPPTHPTQHLSTLSMTKRQKSVDAHLSMSMSSNHGVAYHE